MYETLVKNGTTANALAYIQVLGLVSQSLKRFAAVIRSVSASKNVAVVRYLSRGAISSGNWKNSYFVDATKWCS